MTSKQQHIFDECKAVAKENVRCLTVMMKLVDIGRTDIIESIIHVNNDTNNSITPESIVHLYDKYNGNLVAFTQQYDKAMKEAQYIRKTYYNAYEKDRQSL